MEPTDITSCFMVFATAELRDQGYERLEGMAQFKGVQWAKGRFLPDLMAHDLSKEQLQLLKSLAAEYGFAFRSDIQMQVFGQGQG